MQGGCHPGHLQNPLTYLCFPQSQALAAADAEAGLGRGQAPAYTAGICGGWAAVGPCHKQRYLRYTPGEAGAGGGGDDGGGGGAAAKAGALLAQIKGELFGSVAFARLLSKVRRCAW